MKPDLYKKIVTYILDGQNKFYRLAYSYAQNKEDALDIVQNAVCRALENYESLRNEEAIRTWMYRIVVNESLAALKKQKTVYLADYAQEEVSYEEKGFDLEDDLYDQINCLEVDVQNIIKLRFYEDLSLKEIAQAMDMNLNTVKAKLYRGLRMLKIIEEGGR